MNLKTLTNTTPALWYQRGALSASYAASSVGWHVPDRHCVHDPITLHLSTNRGSFDTTWVLSVIRTGCPHPPTELPSVEALWIPLQRAQARRVPHLCSWSCIPEHPMEVTIVLSWILVGLAMLSAYLLHGPARTQKLRFPPGPKGVPILGNLSIFTSPAPHRELFRISQLYGPLFSIRLGSKPTLVVSSPELAREMLKVHDQNFADRPNIVAKDYLFYANNNMAYCPYNSHYKNMRKVLVMELLNNKRLQQFEQLRAQELSIMIRSIWEERNRESVVVAAVDLNVKMCYLTMNIMTQMMMSKRFFTYGGEEALMERTAGLSQAAAEAAEFKHLMDAILRLEVVALLEDYVPYLSFLDRVKNYKADMQKVRKRVDSFLGKVIADHRRTQTKGEEVKANADFLHVLLSLPGPDGAERWTDDNLKGFLLDLFIAGTDTSSVTVEWAMSELLRHPQIMKKAQQELDTVVGTGRLVAESDLPQLPYLVNIVKETFRLHPVVPLLIPHESVQPCQVLGYEIPAKTRLLVNVWGMGRSSEVWEDALSFNPDRFQERDLDVRGKHFELLPFGTGRRGCPGITLGLTLVQYSLARLLQAFTWSLPDGNKPEDLDMSEAFGLTLPRAEHLIGIPSPRLSPNMYEAKTLHIVQT